MAPARPSARPSPKAPAPAPPPRAEIQLTAEESAAIEVLSSTLDELDYFQILKLPKEAPPSEIKRAFYRESRIYHPDRFYHLADQATKEKVHEIYKRITEAYSVLRDDLKRRKYIEDISGPDRKSRLRFTELSEAEAKQLLKKEQEEQIGTHPKGRHFYQTAMNDIAAENWNAAERNLKMALTFEPSNARYKEKLTEVQNKLHELSKQSGDAFKIK